MQLRALLLLELVLGPPESYVIFIDLSNQVERLEILLVEVDEEDRQKDEKEAKHISIAEVEICCQTIVVDCILQGNHYTKSEFEARLHNGSEDSIPK